MDTKVPNLETKSNSSKVESENGNGDLKGNEPTDEEIARELNRQLNKNPRRSSTRTRHTYVDDIPKNVFTKSVVKPVVDISVQRAKKHKSLVQIKRQYRREKKRLRELGQYSPINHSDFDSDSKFWKTKYFSLMNKISQVGAPSNVYSYLAPMGISHRAAVIDSDPYQESNPWNDPKLLKYPKSLSSRFHKSETHQNSTKHKTKTKVKVKSQTKTQDFPEESMDSLSDEDISDPEDFSRISFLFNKELISDANPNTSTPMKTPSNANANDDNHFKLNFTLPPSVTELKYHVNTIPTTTPLSLEQRQFLKCFGSYIDDMIRLRLSAVSTQMSSDPSIYDYQNQWISARNTLWKSILDQDPPKEPIYLNGQPAQYTESIDNVPFDFHLAHIDDQNTISSRQLPKHTKNDIQSNASTKTKKQEHPWMKLPQNLMDPKDFEKLCLEDKLTKSNWLNIDLRYFNFSSLGKFSIIYADPPWQIRGQSRSNGENVLFSNNPYSKLDYATMTNPEIINMDVSVLSDEGFCFLWVISSQMEVGLQCLKEWGYTFIDSIKWIKQKPDSSSLTTTQGWYFLHSSEICLVGVKTNTNSPLEFISKVSSDVLFCPVREPSQKPDEMYEIMELMMPGAKKIELFARNHNLRPGWFSIGNQLGMPYSITKFGTQCNSCSEPIVVGNPRFKSIKIPNYDLCEKCWNNSGSPSSINDSNISQSDTFDSEAKPNSQDFLCIANKTSEPVKHHFISCNDCGMNPIIGCRFSCVDCNTTDLCEWCLDQRIKSKSLESEESSSSEKCIHSNFKVIEVREAGAGLPIHHTWCRVCSATPIIGNLFVCQEPDCSQVAICQACFFDKSNTHPGKDHEIVIVTNSFRYNTKKCSICKTMVTSAVYQCNSCYEYHICEQCFILKKPKPASNIAHRKYHTYTKVCLD